MLKRLFLALTSPVWFPVALVSLLLMQMGMALFCGLVEVWGWVARGDWGRGETLWKKYQRWLLKDD